MSDDLRVALAIAVPALVIAAGLLLNAYLLYRRSQQAVRDGAEAVDRQLGEMVTGSSDELLATLQRSIDEVKGQLAGQRSMLSGLLSEGLSPAATGVALPGGWAVPEAPSDTRDAVDVAVPAGAGVDFLHRIVGQLADEGLSDRAIARRLSVGLEEVRLARRAPGGVP